MIKIDEEMVGECINIHFNLTAVVFLYPFPQYLNGREKEDKGKIYGLTDPFSCRFQAATHQQCE
jgi:hypothetical protein